MSGVDDGTVETRIRAFLEEGRSADGVELAVKHFGPRIAFRLGRLVVKEVDVLQDALQATWVKLLENGAQVGSGSLLGWLHVVARNEALQAIARGSRRAGRALPLSAALVSQIAEQLDRSVTLWKRPDVATGVRALWRELKPADQELLELRVDEDLAFADIARLVNAPVELDGAKLDSEVARLTKRFHRLTQRLAALARERGILPAAD